MLGTWPIDGAVTLLLVDDDKNITNSLQRALRGKPYDVLTAQNGDAALQILENKSVDLVISDGRMPGMDGATLLAEVQRRWPDIIRIMLTGYSDISATIKAINEGRIYRYLSKPWNDAELYEVIEDALAQQGSDRERARLQELTSEQNEVLQALNENLETHVQERTAELTRTNELLRCAHADLQRGYATTTEVLASLVNQRLPQAEAISKQIMALVDAFCKAQELPQKLSDDLATAAALYNVGKLTWPDALIGLPADRMDRDQRERYRDYPRNGEALLIALDPANEAATFIRHHQERWDGAGFPDGLAGHAIPLGARILKLAVDFVEMQEGVVLTRKLTREEVLTSMPKYVMRLYDPILCPQFVEVASKVSDEKATGDEAVIALNIPALEPGMIMVRHLHAASGMLLLKEGQVLTENVINKLQAFEQNDDITYTLHVRRPEQDESEE
ncbi:MAG TPA: HD domain-containing phosphohydrolase [Eoetvoesiella sp.]